MKLFKQFHNESRKASYEWFTFEVDNHVVHILFVPAEKGVLEEAMHHGIPLGGQYSAQLHNPHSAVGQHHLHIYAKNNKLFAMNIDGSAHDNSHGRRVPNRVAAAIAQQFPQFKLPKDNLIENAPEEIIRLLREQILLG